MCVITRYYLVKVIKDFHNLKKGMSVHILLDDPNRKKYKPSGFLGWIFGAGRPCPVEIAEAFNKRYFFNIETRNIYNENKLSLKKQLNSIQIVK